MRKLLYLITGIAAIVFASCKKDKNTAKLSVGPYAAGSNLQKTQDSMYMFAKEDYFWADGLPDYATFAPRSYTAAKDIDALTNMVDAYSQLKINPATGKPYEYSYYDPGIAKYSFVDDGKVTGELSGNNSGDFGINIFYNDYNDLRVSLVYPNSPAATAGLVRGLQIISVNDNTNIGINPSSANVSQDPNLLFVTDALNKPTLKLTLRRGDGTTFTTTVNAAPYTINPVIKYKTVDLGSGKIVGYLVFNNFTALDVSKPKLLEAFTYFQTKNITELVVDLRYNGGGLVETSEYLANLLVPASKSGSRMYTYNYAANLQADKYPILAAKFGTDVAGAFKPENNQTPFAKEGSLNLSRVFFLVSGNTATAIELTINNLLPEMDVRLIGTTTYGKPVGFFSQINFGGFYLFTPEFSTVNSAGQGDYYAGMTPASATYPGFLIDDDITKDFGDETEGMFAAALNFIKGGKYSASTGTVNVNALSRSKTMSLDMSRYLSIQLNDRHFRGMGINILSKFKMKKK